MILRQILGHAAFQSAKMGKVSLASGDHLYAGLNCFEPAQKHEAHIHSDQDKMYLVLEGSGEISVGGEIETVSPGDLALAPAGVPHGIANTGPARLVVLTVFAPPPKR